MVYVNQVGGNDQLVFDGTSFAMNAAGELVAAAVPSRKTLIFAIWTPEPAIRHQDLADECEAAYQALVLAREITSTSAVFRRC